MIRKPVHGAASILAGLCCASALAAQPPIPPGMPDAAAKIAAMQTAQAAARRPGDEALGCGALRDQVIAAMDDPAMKAYRQTVVAATANQTGPVLSIPLEQQAQLAKQMQAAMPAIFRAQRLFELATVRNCPWTTQGDPALSMPALPPPSPSLSTPSR
ncbi:MAG: hypothetical protein QM696_06465 [Steroidobacteraceae bacterium]